MAMPLSGNAVLSTVGLGTGRAINEHIRGVKHNACAVLARSSPTSTRRLVGCCEELGSPKTTQRTHPSSDDGTPGTVPTVGGAGGPPASTVPKVAFQIPAHCPFFSIILSQLLTKVTMVG